MKKAGLLAMVLVIGGLLLGCATVGVPEKSSADDCLLIIKTKVENPHDVEVARYYHLNITGYDKSVSVPKTDEGLIHLKISNDSTRLESIISGVHQQGYKGDYTKDEINAKLPYAPGEVIIYDYMFVQQFKRLSSNRIQSNVGFMPLPEEERQKLLKKIRESEAYSNWR